MSGKLYALDAASGAKLWTADIVVSLAGDGGLRASGLTAGDGLLVVPVHKGFVAYTLSDKP